MRHCGRGDEEIERESLRSCPFEPTGQRRGGLIDGEHEAPLCDRINVLLLGRREPGKCVEFHHRHNGNHRRPSIGERAEQRGATQFINDHVRVEEDAHTRLATSRTAPRTEDLMLTISLLSELPLPGNGILRQLPLKCAERAQGAKRGAQPRDRILRQRIHVPVMTPHRTPCPGRCPTSVHRSFHTPPPYPRLTPRTRRGTVTADLFKEER